MAGEETQAPQQTGNPIVDAILREIGAGANASDSTLDIILGLDPAARVFEAPGQTRWANRLERYTTPDTTTSVGDLFTSFFEMEGPALRDLQYNLYVGGFYSPSVQPEDIGWGVSGDAVTMDAWQQAVVRSARFYAAGKKITVDDVISAAAQAAGEDSATPRRRDTLIQPTDPAALSDTIDDSARKVLGRKATAEEKRLFIAAMHAAERSRDVALSDFANAQAAASDPAMNMDNAAALRDGMAPTSADTSVTATVPGVSPAARADEFAREFDPLAADSRDVVANLNVIAEMLRGAR